MALDDTPIVQPRGPRESRKSDALNPRPQKQISCGKPPRLAYESAAPPPSKNLMGLLSLELPIEELARAADGEDRDCGDDRYRDRP
jgi:hypothetical protein